MTTGEPSPVSHPAAGNADRPASRRRAAAAAGHAGDEVTARRYLDDDDPGVRATALAALVRSGHVTPADVVAALRDPHPTVRRRACAAAIPFGQVDLTALLADTDVTVVEAAAWALGERSGDSAGAVPALVAIAGGHDDALCREAAVAALGAIGHGDGLPAILAAMGDKPAVRRRAVLALAPFDGPEVDAALRAALEDRDWQTREAAADLLGDDPEE